MVHTPNNGDPLTLREIDPTTKRHNPLARSTAQEASPKVVTANDQCRLKLENSNYKKEALTKVAVCEKKMDVTRPILALKETAEKRKILDNNDAESCESEDNATAATNLLTDDD